jgi:HPt (histidine-containing phosphotransfer) domain-containing protein
MWPYLVLSGDILSDLGLNNLHVQLYRQDVGTWLNIKVGHQITVKEGDRIFLKARSVKSYQDFDKHLEAGMASTVVHLHHNLVGECAYLRKEALRWKDQSLKDQPKVLELTYESDQE